MFGEWSLVNGEWAREFRGFTFVLAPPESLSAVAGLLIADKTPASKLGGCLPFHVLRFTTSQTTNEKRSE